MKSIQLILTAAILFVTQQGLALETNPKQVKSSFHTGYMPFGFDTNDHVQIVGEGLYMNSCFRPAGYKTDVDMDKKEIHVQPLAYEYSGMCLQVLVPYSQTVELGVMKEGVYKVLMGEKRREMGELNIRVARSSNADDYMYAPIHQAFLDSQPTSNKLTLVGEFTNSCVRFEQTIVDVQPNVIVVQPITEVEEKEDCRGGHYPFKEVIEIRQPINKGRYLLHVRSMNGKAINNLVDIH